MKRTNRDIVFDKAEHIKNLIDKLEKDLADKDLNIDQQKILLDIHDEADDIMCIIM